MDATESPVIGAAEVGALVGLDARTVRRHAQVPGSPYHAAKVVDGVDTLRFRRADIMRIVNGETASVVPMRRRA